MGKYLAFLAVCALMLGAGDADAKRITGKTTVHDATWLANEDVMTSNITQARGNIPVGTIIAWPHLGGLPNDADNWVECDGRAVPVGSDLYKLGVTKTPDLYAGKGKSGQGFFLRAGSTPGLAMADQLRSHNHLQPSHTHEVEGQLTSTTVAGTADGQKYYDVRMGMTGPTGSGTNIIQNSDPDYLKHLTSISGAEISGSYNFPGNGRYSGDLNGLSAFYEAASSGAGLSNAGGVQISILGFGETVLKSEKGSTQSSTTGSGGGGSTGGGGDPSHSHSVVSHTHSIPNLTVNEMYTDAGKQMQVYAQANGWVFEGGSDYAEDSDVHGRVVDGGMTGTAKAAGDDPTYFTAMVGANRSSTETQNVDTETAPTYYTTRYFMRINE